MSTWRVAHICYCGMTIPLGQGYTFAEAQDRMRRRIDWFERVIGGEVTLLGGPSLTAVEFQEPEICHMVPDSCGVAYIREENNA